MAIPHDRWNVISVDFIIELPDAHGYDTIMNIIDTVTKRAHFIPTHMTITTEGAALLFLRDVWKHHRLLLSVISDRDSQFSSKFTWELY